MFCFWLVVFSYYSSLTLVIVMGIVQALYLLSLFSLRPFNSQIINMVEIINEIFYLYLVLFLLGHHVEADWNDTARISYIVVMIMNTLIVATILIGKYGCKLYSTCYPLDV